jgi:hypothetical protein
LVLKYLTSHFTSSPFFRLLSSIVPITANIALIRHKPHFCHHVTIRRRPLSALLSQYLAIFSGSKVGRLLLSTSAIGKATHCCCNALILGAGALFVTLADKCEGDCVAKKFTCRKEALALDIENCRMTRCAGSA